MQLTFRCELNTGARKIYISHSIFFLLTPIFLQTDSSTLQSIDCLSLQDAKSYKGLPIKASFLWREYILLSLSQVPKL